MWVDPHNDSRGVSPRVSPLSDPRMPAGDGAAGTRGRRLSAQAPFEKGALLEPCNWVRAPPASPLGQASYGDLVRAFSTTRHLVWPSADEILDKLSFILGPGPHPPPYLYTIHIDSFSRLGHNSSDTILRSVWSCLPACLPHPRSGRDIVQGDSISIDAWILLAQTRLVREGLRSLRFKTRMLIGAVELRSGSEMCGCAGGV